MKNLETQHKKIPRLLLDEVFSDFESMARALGWDQDFRQLESGKLEANLLVVGNKDCQAIRVNFNRSFHQLGMPPVGYLAFGLPDIDETLLRWAGTDLKSELLVSFNRPEGLEITNRGALSGTILHFNEASLRQNLDLVGLSPDTLDILGDPPYWIPEAGQLAELKAQLATLFDIARDTGNHQALREYQDGFDFEFAVSVLQAIQGSSLPQLPLRTRLKVLKRALEFIDKHPSGALSVSTLCRSVGASYSTLQRAFMEEFGIPPKVYLRNRQLGAVQKELANAGQECRISDIANRWGFWHMSAFSADYKKQFGELPSETKSRHVTSESAP